jgi:hypothetical protein
LLSVWDESLKITVCVVPSSFVQVTLPPAAILTTWGPKAKFFIVTLEDCGTGCAVAVGAGVTVGVTAGVALATGVGDAVGTDIGVAVGAEHPARSVPSTTSAIITIKAVLVYTFGSQ